MVLSLACILAGLACLALVVFGFIARDWRVGIILTLLVSLPALLLTRAGLGGWVTGSRFMKLPASWREPATSSQLG